VTKVDDYLFVCVKQIVVGQTENSYHAPFANKESTRFIYRECAETLHAHLALGTIDGEMLGAGPAHIIVVPSQILVNSKYRKLLLGFGKTWISKLKNLKTCGLDTLAILQNRAYILEVLLRKVPARAHACDTICVC
jgi:hypothetical protein